MSYRSHRSYLGMVCAQLVRAGTSSELTQRERDLIIDRWAQDAFSVATLDGSVATVAALIVKARAAAAN